jgi:aryl-alcohol dehydrogenase-like predicted oxidoreductase
MKKRLWKKAQIEIPEISFGAASLSGEGGGYGFGEISEENAIKLVLKAYEKGYRLFDTAPIYGFGLSEKRLGKALKNLRDQVLLVSKGGITWHENKRVNLTNEPKIIESMLHQSLKDLKTDYIDLYMIHWPDPRVDIRRPLDVLKEAQDKGKIRFIGLCNTSIEELNKAQEICEISMVQNEFNLFANEIKNDLFPYLLKHEIGFMSWGTLDKGILSGTVSMDRKYDASDARSWAPWWKNQNLKEKLEQVKKWQENLPQGKTIMDFALEFNLSFKEITTVLIGVKTLDQLNIRFGR